MTVRTRLLQPDILRALAAAGHGSRVLVSDGNFPHSTGPYAGAARVYLNLAPDLVRVTDVLPLLAEAIPIEAATLMDPVDGWQPPAHDDIVAVLPPDTTIEHLDRFAYYDATRDDRLCLVIATADTRVYANVLITIGVVLAEERA